MKLQLPSNSQSYTNLFADHSVACSSLPVSDAFIQYLHPKERILVDHTVCKRQREFATGRALAKLLLKQINTYNHLLLRDEDGLPEWPKHTIGSISHCEDLCVVAVANQYENNLSNLGIDVELYEPLEKELWSIIANQSEFTCSMVHSPQPGLQARALFSIKEATYKCIFPLTRIPIDFLDVQVTIDYDRLSFRSRILHDRTRKLLHKDELEGKLHISDKHIISAVSLQD